MGQPGVNALCWAASNCRKQGDKMHASLPAAHAYGMCWAAAYKLFTKGCRRVSGCHQQAHMHGEQAALSRAAAHFWKHCWALPANCRRPMSGACPSHQKQGAGSADSLRLPVCTTSVWRAKLHRHSSTPSSQESRDWPLVASSEAQTGTSCASPVNHNVAGSTSPEMLQATQQRMKLCR